MLNLIVGLGLDAARHVYPRNLAGLGQKKKRAAKKKLNPLRPKRAFVRPKRAFVHAALCKLSVALAKGNGRMYTTTCFSVSRAHGHDYTSGDAVPTADLHAD